MKEITSEQTEVAYQALSMRHSRKATHGGTCQCCGSFRKLPYGEISKHGYTRRSGWFEGVCPGAHELPFEVSCGLVVKFVEIARKRLVDLEGCIEQALSGDTLYTTTYLPGKGAVRGREVFVPATLHAASVPTVTRIVFQGRGYPTEQVETIYGKTVAQVEQDLRQRRADSYRKHVADVQEYIAWQEKRLREWSPRALIPLEVK